MKIGLATIVYSKDGQATSASFEPLIKVNTTPEILQQLSKIRAPYSEELLRYNTDTVLAAWFEASNDIELADRTKKAVKSRIAKCLKYPGGQIKECQIEYYFLPLNEDPPGDAV